MSKAKDAVKATKAANAKATAVKVVIKDRELSNAKRSINTKVTGLGKADQTKLTLSNDIGGLLIWVKAHLEQRGKNGEVTQEFGKWCDANLSCSKQTRARAMRIHRHFDQLPADCTTVKAADKWIGDQNKAKEAAKLEADMAADPELAKEVAAKQAKGYNVKLTKAAEAFEAKLSEAHDVIDSLTTDTIGQLKDTSAALDALINAALSTYKAA